MGDYVSWFEGIGGLFRAGLGDMGGLFRVGLGVYRDCLG
jgi:hypothetical protein